ncbi:hypothetical protein PVAND_010043 [Polypedilum vanderplanki]|uniref:BAH domain-containing protein n=1 Tax=Polypedilum vanderplanki TaxID=319348 RepID=A0A9J6CG02_POLVA|nr:hypothetical protein PVAND_010043 [Polypedilum vanderplanki]
MKINNCKLCEIYDNQKLSSDKTQPQFCRHTAATFLSQTQLALAFHLLRGYYQPAGPLISPHLLPPPPTSLESDQTQSNQPTSGATGENDPDVMITGGDIAPRPQQQQPYRYGPHPPPPDFSRPLHPQQMHYPPTYPPYYYGQPPPPTDLCYPYYPPKYYPNSPYASRRPYMAPSYYQPPPLDYRSPPQPVPQNAPQQIVPAAPTPQHIDPHYSSAPYYPSAYNIGQCYSQTPPRNLQPPAYLDAHQYHSASCPCPMQSCQSKNVHTGTGPTNKAKGPVSASSNGMAESSSATVLSCKIENNILSPSVLIKPENDKMNGTSSTSIENQNQIGMGSGVLKVHELYPNIPTNVKVLDTPQLSLSPARGSTGIQQIPTVQHEAAVQPTENNLNSDNVSLSLRKQARIGKSMERDRQQQNHTNHGYHNHLLHHHNNNNHSTMIECGSRALEMTTQFKQEFPVKKERESDVKVEKNCDDDMDIEMDFRSSSIKVEQPELPIETTQKLPENDVTTVNLTTESGDECGIDYTIKKRKHDDSDADVIVLSDNNSTQDTPIVTPPVKRRKLLETPINTPKKSSPNSYKNLIKPNAFATSTSEATTVASTPTVAVTKPKLLASNANKSKQSIKRKSLLKSKSNSFKTIGFAIKAKRRALLKRKKQQQQQQRKALEVEEKSQSQNITNTIEKLSSDNDQLIENATEQSVLIEDENDNSSETCEQASTEISEHNEEKSMDGSSEYSGKSNIDLTIDRVAKGYFSESDVFSSLSKHRKTKSQKRFEAKLLDLCAKKKKKMLNGKDKDLTVSSEKEKSKKKTKNSKVNKEKETKEGTSVTAAVNSTLDREMSKNKKVKEKTSNASKKTKKTKTKEPKENLELIKEKKKTKTTSGKKKKNLKEIENEKDILQPDELLPSTHSTPKRKQNNNKKVSTNTAAATPIITTPVVNEKKIETSTIDSDEDDKTIVPKDEDTSTSLLSTATTTTTTTVKTTKPHLDETDVANNNNECFEDNNNRQKQQEPLTLYKTAAYGWTTAINKASGKKGRKGRKLKLTLPNDIVIPKSTSIPRWSNGWVFEGEPYQALVFLNSDDPPVPRTCYDSMRHEECGDVIRPRDCVLLRAGGKRNELPYVAKVAQLFENPEDGEMMMSLFWYYRPEHTEQGRQCNDAIDEVFASRHKDHNSVACIEDKCYVITYNEYCRYRKSLKAVEENIEEPPSVVPKLQLSERRLVPPNTSPELVMFCRRVYDFRAKRLMDDKKKK